MERQISIRFDPSDAETVVLTGTGKTMFGLLGFTEIRKQCAFSKCILYEISRICVHYHTQFKTNKQELACIKLFGNMLFLGNVCALINGYNRLSGET